jgi:predicted enzyme related to lactoylglutathione lyase
LRHRSISGVDCRCKQSKPPTIMDASHDTRLGSFCWVELVTTDLPASKVFYGSLFGWSATDELLDGVPYSILTVADREVGGMTALSKEAKRSGTASYWFSYVAVTDADAIATQAAALGGNAVLGPLQMGPANVAVLRDPTGAVFGVWQSLDATGTFDEGQANAVSLNELTTPNVEQAGRFYAGLFGWRELAGESAALPYKTFMMGEKIVAGMLQGKGETTPGAAWTVYFSVSDAARVVEKATYLGGTALVPLREVPNVGRLAVLSDPGGAVFAVIELAGGVVQESKESTEPTARIQVGAKRS